MIPPIDIIKKAQSLNPWDLGNSILYRLCNEYFEHKREEIILAKVWLIGRSYASAIERRKNKNEINDNFYIKTVAPTFQFSKIDDLLIDLKKYDYLDDNNLLKSLKVHFYLTEMINKITEQNKRSFCSKYLHFHLPELFFLYDSRTVNSIRSFISRVPENISRIIKNEKVDFEYAKFFCKCYILKIEIEKRHKIKLKNRELDNLLISIANEKLYHYSKNYS